jgi:hypothetical protein
VRFGRDHGEVFAEIDLRRQLGDRQLASANFIDVRAVPQPHGQRLFADLGARGVEQLKQRRRPKEIEIVSEAMALEKPRAVGAGAGPRRAQPRHAALVQLSGATAALHSAKHADVDDGKHEEPHQEHERPDRRDTMADERLPGKHGDGRGERQPGVRDERVRPIRARDFAVPALDAPAVFHAWVRCHRELVNWRIGELVRFDELVNRTLEFTNSPIHQVTNSFM